MIKFETGVLAESKAGHDKGHLYIILKVDEAYVYLVDGTLKTKERPKKKKRKHVQLINKQYNMAGTDDVAIKRILKEYKEKAVKKEENEYVKS